MQVQTPKIIESISTLQILTKVLLFLQVTSNAEYDFNMLIDCLRYHVEEAKVLFACLMGE